MEALRRSRVASDGDSTRLRVILLVLSSVVAGLVVAGLALPILGTIGLEARHEADAFDALPSVLAEPPLPQSSIVYDAKGNVLATFSGQENRTLVTIDQVPLVMQQAIIAVEDSRFYEHHGVDFRGTLRALVNNGSGGARQGGSTLTQQYVKNVLEHSPDPAVRKEATDDTLARKLREARYALALERRYTKAQILEKYLNIANFGNGEYGVGTAAQYYYGESVDKLTLPQAAMLAGIVNAPSAYDPLHHPQAARDRRTTVLNAMLKQQYISQAQFDSANATPLPKASHVQRSLDACQTSESPLFCDYVRTEIELDPQMGTTKQDRDDRLFAGGLRIKTTLDMSVQTALQNALNAKLPANPRIVAMGAAVKPGTGEVLALGADRPYGAPSKKDPLLSKVDYPIQSFLQPGSTFKAFTLATALKQGIGVHLKLHAPPCYHSNIFANPQPDDCFHNAGDGEACVCDVVSGTANSVNTFYIQLEEKTGVLAVKQTAEDMGIPEYSRYNVLNAQPVPVLADVDASRGSLTIGGLTNGAAAIDMATGYATLAAHGLECDPHGITSITDAKGNPVDWTPPAACHQALDPAVADTETSVLENVLIYGTAGGKGLAGRQSAGKTGTTDNQAAAWFVGYTPQLTMAIAMGDPQHPSSPMGAVTEGGGNVVDPVFGGTIPADIWQMAMNAALAGKPVVALPGAVSSIANGKTSPVPSVVGDTLAEATSILEGSGFSVAQSDKPIDSDVPAGRVAAQDPSGYGPVGTVVTLTLSTGKHPQPPKSPHPGPGPGPGGTPSPGVGQPSPTPTAGASPTGDASTAPPPPSDTPTPPGQGHGHG